MRVKKIVEAYLKDGGYDGLINCEVECECELEDLFPCDCVDDDCEPGYKKPDPDSAYGRTMTRQNPKEVRT